MKVIDNEEKQDNMFEASAQEEKEQRSENKGKLFILGMLSGLAVAAVVVLVSAMFARSYAKKQSQANQPVQTQTQESIINDASVKKISTLENLLHTYYYEELDEETIEDGLYSGIMNSAGDPYTCYYSPEELKELSNEMQGIYQGVGAYLTMDLDKGYAMVTGTIAGTPAADSDIQIGDYIYKVDGEDVYGLTLTEVVQRVRGEAGTTVNITMKSASGKTYDVALARNDIETPTVEYELKDNDIAYITITEFDDVTVSQFTDAMAKMKADNAKGMILDLRGNPGGGLSTVVEVARQILPEGMIVYTEDKYGERTEYTCDGANKLTIPLIVLVDQNSASAAEILAGAVKDYKLGTLVGMTTYGKGIVQKVLALEDGSAIKITVSKYYTPNGQNIHKKGIEPDVTVEFDADAYLEDKTDSQLEKAYEMIYEELGISYEKAPAQETEE